jgi:hypothetical protein
MFVAMTHFYGCLPDTAEDLPTFETAAEAWTYLADSLSEEEGWTPENEDDPEGPHRRSGLALDLEEHARLAEQFNHTGTIYTQGGSYCYSVEHAVSQSARTQPASSRKGSDTEHTE